MRFWVRPINRSGNVEPLMKDFQEDNIDLIVNTSIRLASGCLSLIFLFISKHVHSTPTVLLQSKIKLNKNIAVMLLFSCQIIEKHCCFVVAPVLCHVIFKASFAHENNNEFSIATVNYFSSCIPFKFYTTCLLKINLILINSFVRVGNTQLMEAVRNFNSN